MNSANTNQARNGVNSMAFGYALQNLLRKIFDTLFFKKPTMVV